MSDKERMAYYNWLLGQAEKVMNSQQEIIKVNYAEYGQLQEKYKKAKEEIEFLKEELQQAQEALRFYADENNWNEIPIADDYVVSVLKNGDSGEVAREALGESECEK